MFFFLIIFNINLVFAQSSGVYSSNKYKYRYAAGSPATKNLNFDKLVKIVDSAKEPYTVETALENLQTYYPELFETYVLMHRSRSLQQSSFLNPRVLLIGSEAKFIVTYNGDPRHHGYQSLETMEFDSEEGRFTFREILFQNGKAIVSKANPRKCLNCHQSVARKDVDPRPNWEPYNLWPGAYGIVGHGNDFLRSYTNKFDPLLYEEFIQQDDRYREFKDYAKTHPRYKYLEPIKENEYGRYFDSLPVGVLNRMTTNLTEALNILNSKRVYRILKNHPHMDQYGDIIWADLICSNIELPPRVLTWLQEKYSSAGKLKRNLKEFIDTVNLYFAPLGIDTTDWSMDFQTAGKFATNRFSNPGSNRIDYLIRNHYRAENKGYDCDLLKEKANRDLEKLTEEDLEKTWQSFYVEKKPLLNQCMTCHAETFTAPFIPFNNEDQLRAALDQPGYKRGTLLDEIIFRTGPHATFRERMPANGYIPTTEEVEELKEYLKSL